MVAVTEHRRPLKTLERVLSKAGLGSRTEARKWIHQGRVRVNGRPTENPDQWVDMERELRKRKLPLVSLESARPLKDFDVVGMSLQYELTYTNCLTLLELGGIPLRAEDRGEDEGEAEADEVEGERADAPTGAGEDEGGAGPAGRSDEGGELPEVIAQHGRHCNRAARRGPQDVRRGDSGAARRLGPGTESPAHGRGVSRLADRAGGAG